MKLFLQLKREDMEKADALLTLTPGDVPVYMHIPDEKLTLLAPAVFWCDASENCIGRMKELLGEENVKTVTK